MFLIVSVMMFYVLHTGRQNPSPSCSKLVNKLLGLSSSYLHQIFYTTNMYYFKLRLNKIKHFFGVITWY